VATSDLPGSRALITGAASGIGRAAAIMLAKAGVHVALADLDRDGAQAACEEARGHAVEAVMFETDLATEAAPGQLFSTTLAAFGRIDILVNCAGVLSRDQTLLECGLPDWRRVHTVNLEAPLFLMQAFARHAISRGGGGRIVNVTSSSAFHPNAWPSYASSKAALTHLTRVVARELGPHGINVNAVAPGLTETGLARRMGDRAALEAAASKGRMANFLRRVAEPDDVAAAIVFLCSDGARQITGQTIHTSAGSV
jgi:NAD(P)-dependent dehydrogenase (short-subunit alcohol dehydrogenase family)